MSKSNNGTVHHKLNFDNDSLKQAEQIRPNFAIKPISAEVGESTNPEIPVGTILYGAIVGMIYMPINYTSEEACMKRAKKLQSQLEKAWKEDRVRFEERFSGGFSQDF